MNKLRAAFLAGACVLLGAAWLRFGGDAGETAGTVPTTTDLLAETVAGGGFARADAPRAFEFPRDHAAHENFRTEWWYFTGHLSDDSGRPFGFQLTLFRFELDALAEPSDSAWRTPRVFLGHFAVTDVGAETFHAFERMSRALPEVAGIAANPPAVWLDDWRIAFDPNGNRWSVTAAEHGVALQLVLVPGSDPVAQGTGGLSQKSAERGNASHYYSVPRLTATGTLTLPGGKLSVRGNAWLDREWSTSALDRRQAGWDWYALQFDDGATLMYYRLRRRDGQRDAHSAGTWVAADGTSRVLTADDVEVTALTHWRSTATGSDYPAQVRLEVAPLGLDVTLTPRLADQEWRGRFRYWEGAATFSGTGTGGALRGLAYVEMTGY